MSNVTEVNFRPKQPKMVLTEEDTKPIDPNQFTLFQSTISNNYAIITNIIVTPEIQIVVLRGASGPDVGFSLDAIRSLTKNNVKPSIGDLLVFGLKDAKSFIPIKVIRIDAVSTVNV